MFKQKILLGLAGLLVVIGLTGCVTVGRPVAGDQAANIVVGETTRADIEKWFGEPDRTGLDSGFPSVTYLHYRVGLFSKPETTDLTVVYTPDNQVKSFVFSTNQSE